MNRRSFFSELQRRHVYKVGASYAVAGWLLVQVATQVFPFFDVSNIAVRAVVLVVVVGFPIALVLAWIFDLTPDGIERTSDRDNQASPATDGWRRKVDRALNYVLTGLLLVTLSYVAIDKLTAKGPPPTSIESGNGTLSTTPDAAENPSIAVLPFTDLSEGKDQEYFSDGMSEEVLNLLARVPGLSVASRTSSFSFKAKDVTVAQMGQILNVGTLLEGSVRKAGDRLRITAQLVDVANGYSLWSQTYDRQQTDVFAIQEDIAASVVDALKLKLLPGLRPSMAPHHVPDFATYNFYLQGRLLLQRDSQDGEDFRRAAEAFSNAITLDPRYAGAYAGLAMAECFAVENSPDAKAQAAGNQRAIDAADRAVALDPELGDAYAARGLLRATINWDWTGGLADSLQAVHLDPRDERNQLRYGYLLAATGQVAEAAVAFEKSTDQNPLFPPTWFQLARIRAVQTNYTGAKLALERALAIDPNFTRAAVYLGTVALLSGNADEARTIYQKLDKPLGIALAEHSLGHALESQKALDRFEREHRRDGAYAIGTAYAWKGMPDKAFEWLDRAVAQHDSGVAGIRYDPLLKNIRGDPRYLALLSKLKL